MVPGLPLSIHIEFIFHSQGHVRRPNSAFGLYSLLFFYFVPPEVDLYRYPDIRFFDIDCWIVF